MVKFAYCAIYCDLMLTAGVFIERHRRTRLEPYGMRTNWSLLDEYPARCIEFLYGRLQDDMWSMVLDSQPNGFYGIESDIEQFTEQQY